MIITFCIISVVIIAAMIYAFYFFMKKKKLGTQMPFTKEECKAIIEDALTQLNCTPEWNETEHGLSASYIYQAGFFRICISKKSRYVSLAYLYMFETSLANLEPVRELCNMFTKKSENVKLVYSVNGEKNLMNVHIIATLIPERENCNQLLQDEMRNIFGCRNMFYNEFGKMMNDMEHKNIRDIEKDAAEWSRKNFLVHEHELLGKPQRLRFREDGYDHLTLQSFMRNLMSNDSISIISILLCIADEKHQKITETKAILNYHLSDALIRDGIKIRNAVTLVVEYNEDVLPGFTRTAVLHLNYEGGGKKAMYYRVTMMQVPVTSDGMYSSDVVKNVIVAYDMGDKKQNYYEFLYLWKEAQEKKNNNQKLTIEEKLISYTDDEDNAYKLFKARQLFMQHRYYEAVPYLTKVYCYLSANFTKLKVDGIASFYEVCFMLGTSYCDMGDFERALPYLATTLEAETIGIPKADAIRYKKEYVNCLVNSGDYRAMKYVFDLINTIENAQKYRNLSHYWNDFLNFLKRRYIQILINSGFYDDAEIELKGMLEDPDNRDYALDELAHMQKNRKKTDE